MTVTASKTSHTPGKLAEKKDQLYAGFAAGKTSQALADEVGVHLTTIKYHRKKWEEAGRPGAPATPESTQPHDDDLPPPPPAPVDETSAASAAQNAPPALEVADPDNTPATKEQLKQLQAVMSGNAPRTDTHPAPARIVTTVPMKAESDQPQWQIEKGRIYEGSVARVEWNFVLVDLIELADMKGRSPRGKVGMAATGLPPMIRDLRDAKQFGLREGALVNVQVVDVRPNPNDKGRPFIALSLDGAPGHPDGYTPPSHLPKQSATLSVADTNALLKAETEIQRLQERVKAGEEARQRLTADLAAAMATIEQASAEKPVSLCDTCLKADVCHLALNYQDEIELTPEDKPDRLASVQIAYGARPVTTCSAYVQTGKVG